MYEESNKSFFNSGLLLLILKLACLGIFIFLICWFFLRNNKNDAKQDNNSDYINNITSMKDAALEYFTKDKLPKTVGQTQKLTLQEMLDQKLLIDFTEDGKTCNLETSYVQATKTADENYALKVNLNCDKKEDYIVTTIEKKDIECTVNCNNTSSNKQKDTNDNTVSSIVTPNNTKSSNQTNTTNNKTTSSKTTITKKVVTKVTYKYYNFCNNCSSSSSKQQKYYEMVLYGPWQSGKKEGAGYETVCEKVKSYNYCKVRYVNYYGNCYIPESYSSQVHKYSLEVPITGSVNPYLDGYSAYTSLNDYVAYTNAKKSKPNDPFNQVYPNSTPQGMMSSSLKGTNFTIASADTSIKNNNFVINFTVNLNNRNGVNPYYSDYLKYKIYFLPVKFTLGYKMPETCVTDTAANASKYPDYRKFPINDTEVCKYRSVQYKWVKEQDVKKYVESGWKTTGKTKTETI